MSDMGLNASIYEQLRVYADRLDCALVKLHGQNQAAANKARNDLADLLREIGSADTCKPGPPLLAMLLKQELSGRLEDLESTLKTLADVVEKGIPRGRDLEMLENIAWAIDKECLNAGARARGKYD